MSDKPLEKIVAALRAAEQVIPPGSRWWHIKTKRLYRAQSVGVMEASPDILAVAYAPCDNPASTLWIRPYDDFLLKFSPEDRVRLQDAGEAEFDFRCKACGEIMDNQAIGLSQTEPYGSLEIRCPKCGAYKTIWDA